MSGSIEIIAILVPAPGKADRVEQLLRETAEYVKANEPGVLRYHLQREVSGDTPSFVMLEKYKDKASLAVHGGSEKFKALGAAIKAESLLSAPMKLIFSKPVAGFESRL